MRRYAAISSITQVVTRRFKLYSSEARNSKEEVVGLVNELLQGVLVTRTPAPDMSVGQDNRYCCKRCARSEKVHAGGVTAKAHFHFIWV